MTRHPNDGHVNAAQLVGRDLQQLCRDCGIRAATIAAALGVARTTVVHWETRRTQPSGKPGAAYVRFILGLVRHQAYQECLDELPQGQPSLSSHKESTGCLGVISKEEVGWRSQRRTNSRKPGTS